MDNLGKVPNWEVVGFFDRKYPGDKKASKSPYAMNFVAKNSSDAIRQAKKIFEEMKEDHPTIEYSNLRGLTARPLKG